MYYMNINLGHGKSQNIRIRFADGNLFFSVEPVPTWTGCAVEEAYFVEVSV